MSALREPWCAYASEAIRDENGDFMVVYVEEDQPGYWSTTYTGRTFDYVSRVADSINASRGITSVRVIEIVSSSFAAGPVTR